MVTSGMLVGYASPKFAPIGRPAKESKSVPGELLASPGREACAMRRWLSFVDVEIEIFGLRLDVGIAPALARFGPVLAPCGREGPFEIEPLNAVVGLIGDLPATAVGGTR